VQIVATLQRFEALVPLLLATVVVCFLDFDTLEQLRILILLFKPFVLKRKLIKRVRMNAVVLLAFSFAIFALRLPLRLAALVLRTLFEAAGPIAERLD